MAGSITVTPVKSGRVARLVNVACTLGRRDRPYPETHDGAWTVALVRRGRFQYRAADTNARHVLRTGWLLLGRPGAEYECSHEHDDGDDCASLAIAPGVLADVARAANAPEKRVLAAPVLAPVPRVAALVERARRRDDDDVDEIAYLVAEAVVAQAHAAPSAVAPHPRHRGIVHDAIERIESACTEPLPLADLAAEAGLSPFHFLRVFRAVTGTTPHQYVLGARIRLAARLLLDTHLPITRVAYDVGFQDLSNFVRTFHRVVGRSPRAYRRG